MLRHVGLLLLVCAALALVVAPAAAEDKADAQAKEAVEQLAKALKAKDLDAVMKIVDVPWYHDGKKVIKDTAELKAEFEKLLKKEDFSSLKLTIKEVQPYSKVRDRLKEENRKLVDEVLDKDKDDRVVLAEVAHGDKTDEMGFGVRIRDGKARIVGVKH